MTLQTLVLKFQGNGTADLARLGNIRDVSFWNPVAVNGNTATVFVNGVPLIIAAGDPMLSFGGYENIFRSDVFDITFTGAGTSQLIVFANKVLE